MYKKMFGAKIKRIQIWIKTEKEKVKTRKCQCKKTKREQKERIYLSEKKV